MLEYDDVFPCILEPIPSIKSSDETLSVKPKKILFNGLPLRNLLQLSQKYSELFPKKLMLLSFATVVTLPHLVHVPLSTFFFVIGSVNPKIFSTPA